MNCLLLDPKEFDASTGRASISGRRRRHADEILNASKGDRLRVGLVGGRLGRARVLELNDERLELAVEFDRDPAEKLPLTLVMALSRPPVFRRLLSTVASLGVRRILVVGTARTEKSFWQSHVLEPDAMRERLLLGLEQSSDTVLPSVELHRYFEPLVEEVLPPLLEQGRGFLAHPTAAMPCPAGVEGPISVFVGPEGGLIDYEVDKLRALGFECVRVGDRVLRVEPVIPLLVGRLVPG